MMLTALVALMTPVVSQTCLQSLLQQHVGQMEYRLPQQGLAPISLKPLSTFLQAEYFKLSSLIYHVQGTGNVIEPEDAVVAAIEDFARSRGQWLKVAGGPKAECLRNTLKFSQLACSTIAMEFGAFVGYSAVRVLGTLQRDFGPDTLAKTPIRFISLELDPVHVCIVRHHINAARIGVPAVILCGHAIDLLNVVVEEVGVCGDAFFFMDHRGTRFHLEIMQAEHLQLLAPLWSGLADNVLEPGAPVYAWWMARRSNTLFWSLHEFMHESEEDWMAWSGAGAYTSSLGANFAR